MEATNLGQADGKEKSHEAAKTTVLKEQLQVAESSNAAASLVAGKVASSRPVLLELVDYNSDVARLREASQELEKKIALLAQQAQVCLCSNILKTLC